MPETARKVINAVHVRLIAAKLLAVAMLALAITELSIVTRLDTAVTSAIHGWTVSWLTEIVSGISELAGTSTVFMITALAVAALLALRHYHGAAALALAVVSTQLVVTVGKALMTRPRPDDEMAVADPSGWSFPSAHSASAVALYITLALIATTLWRRQLRPGVAFAAAGLIVALVGLSRIYLGAHYPTDVIAGWLTGGVLVVASWALCSRLPTRSLAPRAA
jgi:membrane-associated phospholipid phosphatase